MPDDMTVSTLISHLSGRAPRTFPRELSATNAATNRRLTTVDLVDSTLIQNKHIVDHTFLKSPRPDQSHRRLLWKQKNWGAWREEAINSIVGYFGSIHPGTVGWCASTSYMKANNRGVPFVCHPEKPSLNLLPWLTKGGAGSTQCPLDPNIVQEAFAVAKKADPILAFEDLCGECKYKDVGITCRGRLQFLIDRYNTDPTEAKSAVIKEDANCERKKKPDIRLNPILASDDLCGLCKYKDVGITCLERMQFLIDRFNTDPIEAKSAVMKEDTNCKKK